MNQNYFEKKYSNHINKGGYMKWKTFFQIIFLLVPVYAAVFYFLLILEKNSQHLIRFDNDLNRLIDKIEYFKPERQEAPVHEFITEKSNDLIFLIDKHTGMTWRTFWNKDKQGKVEDEGWALWTYSLAKKRAITPEMAFSSLKE